MKNTPEETVNVSYLAKHTIKDSVFTNLFQDKKYALQLYKALHPEDEKITEDDICIVTLENVLLNKPYNDLGFTVGKHLLILVEAQSTWSPNIVVRGFLYLAQSIQDYILLTKQNIYKSKKVTFPEPEIFVIFTGERKNHPDIISLSDEFFEGRQCALDARVKVIYDGEKGDIIYQYVRFTKVYQLQVKFYGRTQKAVLETIRICKNENILKEYLEDHEKEVVDIMMSLFDKEQILTAYIEEERQNAINEGLQKGQKQSFQLMLKSGIDETSLASALGMDVSQFRKWIEIDLD